MAQIPPGPASVDDYPLAPDQTEPLTLLTALTETYGPIVRCPTAYGYSYLFSDPHHVQHILNSTNYVRTLLLKIVLGDGSLTTDGPVWKQRRKIVQPAFHRPRIEAFQALMTTEAERLATEWQGRIGQTVDVDVDMMRLTLRVACGALFGQEVEQNVARLGEALEVVVKDLTALTATLVSVPAAFSPDRNRRMKKAIAVIDEAVNAIIERRRSAPHAEPTDLLDSLLAARNDDGQPLSDRELRDEVVTMLVAGHETTATTLSWAWYLLSRHPDFDERWRRELDALADRPVTLEDHAATPLTLQLFRETLRLYPPVWTNARKVVSTEVMDGYRIEGNCAAFVSTYTLHRSPMWWRDPNDFKPERFEEDQFRQQHKFAYVPFAQGHHMCTGHHFATIEGRTILITLGRKFRLSLPEGQSVKPAATVTLRVHDGLPMHLSRR